MRQALSQAWYRGVDYAWLLRETGRGLVDPRLPEKYSQGDLAPVLLLPGVLERWTMMRRLADRLNALGHPVHAVPELRNNTVTVPEASALGTAYLAARALNGVLLVAHSKGGLIGKHMLLADVERRIDRLVAVASPFGGSSLARLIPHRTVRIFRPDDVTIVELAASAVVNDRITSIYPSLDPHIPGGSHLVGARNVEIGTVGHFRVLADPTVIAAVVAATRGEAPPE